MDPEEDQEHDEIYRLMSDGVHSEDYENLKSEDIHTSSVEERT